jgi:hypothetical protein
MKPSKVRHAGRRAPGQQQHRGTTSRDSIVRQGHARLSMLGQDRASRQHNPAPGQRVVLPRTACRARLQRGCRERAPALPGRRVAPGQQKAPGRLPRRSTTTGIREPHRAVRRGARGNRTLRSAGRRCYPPRGPAGQGRSTRGSGVCRVFAGRRLCGTQPPRLPAPRCVKPVNRAPWLAPR